MSLRVELIETSERRAGVAAFVRTMLRLALIAAAAAVALLIFVSFIQLWQRHNHVTNLERTWEMIEDRGIQTDATLRQLKHMEQTHAELDSWKYSRNDTATLLKALCIHTPTNMQITKVSFLPQTLGESAPKQKFADMLVRAFSIQINGVVAPPAPNASVEAFIQSLTTSPATTNLVENLRIDNYDANFKTPDDDSDFTFTILGRTTVRATP